MKKNIKKIFNYFGYDIVKNDRKKGYKFKPEDEDKYKWLQSSNIRTVLDIGAHKGESAAEYHQIFPEAYVYSFEPLKDCFEVIQRRFINDKKQKTFNFALGDETGQIQIHRSSFTPGSSILKFGESLKKAFPFASEYTRETINVTTLDEVAKDLQLDGNVLMKIDVQGFEDKVLRGAKNSLNKIKFLIIELSFTELYDGQPVFSEIYNMLTKSGFKYAGSWRQSLNPPDGKVLQQDAIFIQASH